MYDFSPTPEQQAVLERTREIMERYIYPAEEEARRHGHLPEERMRELQARVKEAGLWAPHMPKEAGGLGMGMVTLALMNEELGRSPLIAPRAFGTNAPDTGNQEILWKYGTPEQKERYLKASLAGEVYSCFAMTEPDVSGSDPTTIRTRAVRDGDYWVINGRKWFITNASRAAFAIVMAITDPDAPPHRRASMIIVDAGTPGFRVVRDVPTMGEDGFVSHSEVVFEDCRVPVENTLGPVGEGFRIAQERLGPGRITHAMRWIGMMHRSFELMLERALTRETRGRRLAEFQTVQNFIADSAAEIQACRLLTLYAAWKMDQGLDPRVEISLIKFYGARVLHDVVDRALQVHGALGYSKDTPLEAFYREARAARIYDGPDEVHRMVVARRILNDFARRLQQEGVRV